MAALCRLQVLEPLLCLLLLHARALEPIPRSLTLHALAHLALAIDDVFMFKMSPLHVSSIVFGYPYL